MNGLLVKNGVSLVPNNVIRETNYIGRNSWPQIAYTNGVFADLKIYQGAMTSDQIMNDYNVSSLKGNYIS